MDDDDDYDEDEVAEERGGGSSGGGSAGGGMAGSAMDHSREIEIREQDRYLPIANIARIMKRVLPGNVKIAKDAKESIQMCVSEFISFITSEASDKCQQEKRKTINGDDLLWAMGTLGFEEYGAPLQVYLNKYRESVKGEKPDKKGAAPALKRKEPPTNVQPKYSHHKGYAGSSSGSSSSSSSSFFESGGGDGAGGGRSSLGRTGLGGSIFDGGSFDATGMFADSDFAGGNFAMGGFPNGLSPSSPTDAPTPLSTLLFAFRGSPSIIVNGREITEVSAQDFCGIDVMALAAASTANNLNAEQAVSAAALALQMQFQQQGNKTPEEGVLAVLQQQMRGLMETQFARRVAFEAHAAAAAAPEG